MLNSLHPLLNIDMMSREIIRESDKTVRLCCGKKGCPTVTDVGEGMVEITDDDGNKIVVKKEEAELISDGVRTLDGKKLICG